MMFKIQKFNDYKMPIRQRIEGLGYKENLKLNFNGRCAYCNCDCRTLVGQEFHVEHIVPKSKAEKHGKPELATNYNNMVFACKKCNLHKAQTWPFDDYDLNHTYDKSRGEGFYDPCLVDFNDIFYRNEFGLIMSDDSVGQYMIYHLKLFTLFRCVTWYCDKLSDLKRTLLEKRKVLRDNQEISTALADITEKLEGYLNYISACVN